MPAPKYTAPRRYFTAQDARAAAPPTDRLLYLELLEVDTEDGVARFGFSASTDAADLEVWRGTLPGWESRVDRAALSDATLGQPQEGGVVEIPLSDQPQLTQVEVRNLATGGVTVYWIQTQGSDARSFRYRSFPDDAVAEGAVFGYLVAVADDDYEPTADAGAATHAHALVGGEIQVVAIASADGSVRTRRIGTDDYIVYAVS